MTEIRIGQPPAPAPPARRRGPLYALTAVVLVLVAAGAATAGIIVARHDNATPAANASSETLSPLAACPQLVPLLSSAAKEMTDAFNYPDGSTAAIATTADALRKLEPKVPTSWRQDVVTQYTGLQKIVDAHGDRGKIADVASTVSQWSDAGTRLAEGCRPYAS